MIARVLQGIAEKRELSAGRIARCVNLSENTVRRAFCGENISLETFFKILIALGCGVKFDFYPIEVIQEAIQSEYEEANS